MQTERRVAANPQTKPTDLGCESADRLLSSADTIAIYEQLKLQLKTFLVGEWSSNAS